MLQPWQRFHPLTPLLRGGVVFLGVIGYLLTQQMNRIFGADAEDPTRGHWAIAAGVLVLVLLAIIGGSWVAWRASSFRLGATTVELRHGVLAKQHRQVRYDRIQAVDLRRPLLAQVFGVSAVRVEAAGGAGSNVELAFLNQARAEELRSELIRRAADVAAANDPRAHGLRGDATAPAAQPGAPFAVAAPGDAAHRRGPGEPRALGSNRPMQLIAAIPTGRVWLATALSVNSLFLLMGIPLVIAIVLTGNLGALPLLGPMVLGALWPQLARLSSWMNFRVEAGDGAIRVRHGLTELRTSTIPLHRIQAVEIRQPALWRPLGWWRIQVNVAGVQADPDKAEESIIPVGTLDEVLRILAAMGPRWSLPEVLEGLQAPGPSPSFVGVPRTARRLDPLSWQRIGYAVTPAALISRGGWLGRSVQLVPHERVQSLTLEQGPLERRLQLANVLIVSTAGAVRPAVRHLDVGTATALLNEEAERARAARAAESGPPIPPRSVPRQDSGRAPAQMRSSAQEDDRQPPAAPAASLSSVGNAPGPMTPGSTAHGGTAYGGTAYGGTAYGGIGRSGTGAPDTDGAST